MNIPCGVPNTILYVIPTLTVGGAERQVVTQINALHQNGWKIILLVLSKINISESLLSEVKIPKNKVIFLNSDADSLTLNSLKSCVSYIPQLSKFIYDQNVSLILSHLPIAHSLARLVKICYCIKYRSSLTLIHYHHSLQYQASPLNTFNKKAYNALNSLLARVLDNGNVFISIAAKADVSSNLYIDDSKSCIIHNAIPKVAVNSLLANNYLEENKIKAPYLIVLPGRLNKDKGQIEFIDAFNNFVIRNNLKAEDIKVIIAGGGGLQDEVNNKINSLKIKDYFFISGILNNSLLLSLMHRANLVVIPSINEGFGIVAIEALLAGSLILSSDAGGLKEIIVEKKNGYLFERNNWKQLEEKLDFVYHNFDALQIEKELLLKDFDRRFSFENHIKLLESFLLRLL
jgi:glycosyltransferase involved in cell wall biosynthesis